MTQSPTNISAKALFLDANMLLEVILAKDNQVAARIVIEDQTNNLLISSLTAHLVVHFGQRIVNLGVLRSFLNDYTVLSLESSDFEWAFNNARSNDFEDALQLGVAICNGCSDFLTLDKNLYKLYRNMLAINTHLIK